MTEHFRKQTTETVLLPTQTCVEEPCSPLQFPPTQVGDPRRRVYINFAYTCLHLPTSAHICQHLLKISYICPRLPTFAHTFHHLPPCAKTLNRCQRCDSRCRSQVGDPRRGLGEGARLGQRLAPDRREGHREIGTQISSGIFCIKTFRLAFWPLLVKARV